MAGLTDATAAGEAELSPGERGGMYGGATSIEADSAVIELRLALDEQARELDAVFARFTHARLLMPTSPAREWRGLAQLVYELSLAALGSELDAAEEHLGAALHETRRAAESLGGRVG